MSEEMPVKMFRSAKTEDYSETLGLYGKLKEVMMNDNNVNDTGMRNISEVGRPCRELTEVSAIWLITNRLVEKKYFECRIKLDDSWQMVMASGGVSRIRLRGEVKIRNNILLIGCIVRGSSYSSSVLEHDG